MYAKSSVEKNTQALAVALVWFLFVFKFSFQIFMPHITVRLIVIDSYQNTRRLIVYLQQSYEYDFCVCTGAQHFHLSEKLNTRYSAIAFQRACPYRDNFNDV